MLDGGRCLDLGRQVAWAEPLEAKRAADNIGNVAI